MQPFASIVAPEAAKRQPIAIHAVGTAGVRPEKQDCMNAQGPEARR